MLSGGVDPRTLMAMLGHSQIGITMDLYAHVMPHKLDDAAQRVETLLGGTSDGDAAAASGRYKWSRWWSNTRKGWGHHGRTRGISQRIKW